MCICTIACSKVLLSAVTDFFAFEHSAMVALPESKIDLRPFELSNADLIELYSDKDVAEVIQSG